MSGLLWVASVVCGAFSILSMVDGHVLWGVLLLVLSTIAGLIASAGSINLE